MDSADSSKSKILLITYFIFEQGNKFVFDSLKKNIRLSFMYLNDCIAPAPVTCVCDSESAAHVKLQADRLEIFLPKNQSFSSLIEIYLHSYHIWITWKTHIQRLMQFLSASLNLLRYTLPTLIYEQIYAMSTLSWISLKHQYTGVGKEISFLGGRINVHIS